MTGDQPVRTATWRAMGSECHVVVVDGRPDAVNDARRRIEDLEAKWSRFRDSSELSRINTHPGRPVRVSADTVAVIVAAVAAWRRTRGRFDPTVLDALESAGYDRPFVVGLDCAEPATAPTRVPGCDLVEIDEVARTIAVPTGARLDLGGIAKGLAADLVAQELVAQDAAGALVNVGGDLRVIGRGPDGDGWTVAIGHLPGTAVIVKNGGLATSATTHRRWRRADTEQHHVIDPDTARPAAAGSRAATVFAPTAAEAEVLATAALLAGRSAIALLAGEGASGIVAGPDDALAATPDLRALVT